MDMGRVETMFKDNKLDTLVQEIKKETEKLKRRVREQNERIDQLERGIKKKKNNLIVERIIDNEDESETKPKGKIYRTLEWKI